MNHHDTQAPPAFEGAELHTLTGSSAPGIAPPLLMLPVQADLEKSLAEARARYEEADRQIDGMTDPAVKNELGLKAEEAYKAMCLINEKIVALPTTSVSVLLLKAKALAGIFSGDERGISGDLPPKPSVASRLFVQIAEGVLQLPLSASDDKRQERPGPDADLIQLGRELEEAWAAELEVCRRTDSTAEDDITNDDMVEESDATDRCGLLVDKIAMIPARTLAGIQVKARAYHWLRSGRTILTDLAEGSASLDAVLMAGIINDLRAASGAPFSPSLDDEQAFRDAVELGRVARLEQAAHSETGLEDDKAEEARVARAVALTDELTSLIGKVAATPARSARTLTAKAAAVPLFADYINGCAVPEADEYFPQLARDILTVGSPYAQLPPAKLDEPIVKAWNEHQRLLPVVESAWEAEAELWDRIDSAMPACPDTLRVRETDFPEDSIRLGSTTSIDGQAYYGGRIIDILRSKPRMRLEVDEEATVQFRRNHGLSPDAVDRVVKRVPNAEDQARADEILAAWDAWQAEKQNVIEQTGLEAASAKHEGLIEQLHAAGDLIRDIPAMSLKGIGLKAAWALQHKADGEIDLSGVLEQVEAFARRHAYLDHYPADQIADLEQKLATPVADWDLHRLAVLYSAASAEMTRIDEEVDAGRLDRDDDAFENARTKSRAHINALADLPSSSLEGLRVKVKVFAGCYEDEAGPSDLHAHLSTLMESGSVAEIMALSIARDLARLNEAGGWRSAACNKGTALPERQTLEAYRTWLSNEFRFLTAEMYPDQPWMAGTIEANNAGDRFHFRGEAPASSRAERVLAMFGSSADLSMDVKHPEAA